VVQTHIHLVRKVDVRLPGKGNSNSDGARLVHLIITMIKWIRTSRLSIKNSLSLSALCRTRLGTRAGYTDKVLITYLLMGTGQVALNLDRVEEGGSEPWYAGSAHTATEGCELRVWGGVQGYLTHKKQPLPRNLL